MATWQITQNESGTKLLAFLKEKLGETYSARHLKRAIESNLCEVNGRVERFASYIVGTGDAVFLHLEGMVSENKNVTKESRLLFEDEDLIIYDKPPGIASDSPALLQEVQKAVKSDTLIELVHRLDRDTSGALIFAKSDMICKKMFRLFKQKEVFKSYLALVDGLPTRTQGIIENALGKVHEYQGQSLWGVVEKGLYAYTEWRCEKKGKEASLIRCFPKTGRTHQIRVHLESLGHPILGDHQYGRHFRCKYRPPRILLHAESLSFEHPRSGCQVRINAPIPKDFMEAMKILCL
jgi:23S rRNA pseudouridine955/2504/2580 synthase/23S rRNA pseudouridine1911/1915/1917 synthase